MLRELLASFDVDTGQAAGSLKKLDSAIDGVKDKLGGMLEAFTGAEIVKGLAEFVGHQIELGSQLNDMSERLGVSTEELQKFQFAAGLSGVSAEAAAKSLQFLNKNMGEAIGGNAEAAKTFSGLGIAMKDADGNVRELGDVIPEIADSFGKLGSDQERTAMAMKIFGKSGAALIPLLKDGSKGLAELSEQFDLLGGGMSKEFTKAADEAGDEIDKLKFGFNGLKSKLAYAVLPTVTAVAKKLQEWVIVLHKVFVQTNLAKEAWVAFGIAGSIAAAKMGMGIAKMMGLLPKGASFWKTILGLGEILLVVAAVAILALVFEDLWTGINGGESVIKDWLTATLGVKDTTQFFDDLRKVVDEVKQVFTELGPELKPILADLLKMGVEAGPGIAKAFIWVIKVIAGATTLLAGFVDMIAKAAKGDTSGAGKSVDKAGDSVFGKKGLFGGLGLGQQSNNLADYMKYEGGEVQFMTPQQQAEMGNRGAAGGPMNVTSNVTNNITGVPDAKGAGAAAATGTKDGMADALAAVHGGG